MAESIVHHREHEQTWAAAMLAVWSRRRWLALLCLAVPLSATMAAARFLPSRYRSAALVVVERPLSTGAGASTTGQTSTEAQIQRLHEENQSRSHLKGLIDQFHLYPELVGRASLEATIAQMRRDIKIESKDTETAGGRSLVAFQISFRGREPERVAQVTNALASFYVDRTREQREQQARRAVALLEAEVAKVKEQLEAQGKAVNDFISEHLHELPGQVPVNLATLERLNALLVRNRDLDALRAARPAPERAPEVKADPPDETETQLAQLNEKLNALRGRFTDQHPDVAALRAEIAALAAESAPRRAPQARALANPKPKTDEPARATPSAVEGERQMLRHIAEAEQRVYNAPKRERELELLLSPYQATRQLYSALLTKLEDARLAVGTDRQQALDPFRVLDPAVAAREPIAPDRTRLAAGGMILSLLFAVAVVLLAERLDTSFHSLDELRAFTRVPVLASVPNITSPRDKRRHRRRARLAAILVVLAAGAASAGTYAFVHDNESLVRTMARGL